MYPENRVSLGSGKGRRSFSQGTTAKRVTNADKGPIGKATLSAPFGNLSGDERQVYRELVSRVSGGIREIIGQKVDHVAAIVRPFIYVQRNRHQPIQTVLGGRCSHNALRFCSLINAGSPWLTASQDQISSMIGSSSLEFDSICRRTGSQHYHKTISNEMHKAKASVQTSFPKPFP